MIRKSEIPLGFVWSFSGLYVLILNMLLQMGSLALVGLATYYMGRRILSTSPLFALYPFAVWTLIILFAFVAFFIPAIISHLPREYVMRINPNSWSFTLLMVAFIATLLLMLVTDVFFYLASSHVSPGMILEMKNYRPILVFATAALLALSAI